MGTDETVPARDAPGWLPRWGRRKAVILSVLLAVLVVVGGLSALAVHFADQYFVFSPGTAPLITTSAKCKTRQGQLVLPHGRPCVRLLVPAGKAHTVDGRLLMVDVEVGQASPLQWAEYELGLLGDQRQLVSVTAYAGNTPTSELGCQDAQEMGSSNQDAALAALSVLHYPVTKIPLGAKVYEVLPGTPAWAAGVKCNDVITAVDGKRVQSASAFTHTMAKFLPGTAVTLTDRASGARKAREIKVRLVRPPRQLVESGAIRDRAYLGVSIQDDVKLELPFSVSINAGGIGGPSAGLAFTLAILDALSSGKLTGGHTVAATGTISPSGHVGEVGGVQQKTVAVQRAGAQVFFVPAAEFRQAAHVARKGLRVIPVSTLQQALRTLQRDYGGQLPKVSGGAPATS
jgi:Lon-like protease